MSVDVLAIGEAMAVLRPEPSGPLRHATTLGMSLAGAEANVVSHLAGLGLRTAFVSRVGDDPFGEMIRDRLAAAGVTASIEIDPYAPTGVYFKDPGDRHGAGATRVRYYRAGSAASTMDGSVWRACPPARVVHLTGITPALSTSCAALVGHGLSARPIAGAIMSFDVNYRPRLWPATGAGPALAALANLADIVFVGLDEAAALWGTGTAADVRALIDRPAQLIVKDGPVGATLWTVDGAVFEPAPPVDVIEPVGAGDAFAAGYLYGLHAGRPAAERLRLGHLLAGTALRTTADIGTPMAATDLLRLAAPPVAPATAPHAGPAPRPATAVPSAGPVAPSTVASASAPAVATGTEPLAVGEDPR